MEDDDDNAVNLTGKSIVDDEIDCYLKEPCKKIHVDLLRFWKENTETYPRISKTVEKVLSILASSAAVEKLFRKIHRPELHMMMLSYSDSKFEQLMFIRSNTK